MLEKQKQKLSEYRKQTALKSGDETFLALDFSWVYATLADNAWESAIITQAVKYMDYETVRSISIVYKFQDVYMNNSLKMVDGQSSVNTNLISLKNKSH